MEQVARPPAPARQERSLIEGLLLYYKILLRYKWLIIIATAAAAFLVIVFSVLTILLPPDKSPLPNKYTASALLLVQQGKGSSVSGMLASLGFADLGGGESSDYGQMAVIVLTSRSVVDKLVEEFLTEQTNASGISGRTNTRKYFTDRLSTTYAKAAGTLTVGFTHIDPVFAQKVVNRAVELLDEWFTMKSGTTALRQKELLERKLVEIEGEIAKLEEGVATFQKAHGALRAEDLGVSQMEMLTQLQTQLMEKELAIKNYQSYSNIEDPAIRKLKTERDNIVDLISRIQEGYIGAGRKGPSQDELPDIAIELANLTLGLEIQRRIYETLSQQYEVTKLSVESEPVFQVMEMAEVPDEKSEPSRGKICMIVTVLGFLGSVAFAFAHNSLRNVKKPAG